MSTVSQCRIDDAGRECTKCHEYKPWKLFTRNRLGTSGFESQCRECVFLRTYPGKSRPCKCKVDDEGRECSKCHKYKKWEEFYVNKSHFTGYSTACKKCKRPKGWEPSYKRRQDDQGRECTKCRQYKPWTEFTVDKTFKSGYNCVCKECVNSKFREGRPKPIVFRKDDQGRVCSRCHIYKPWTDFSIQTREPTGHASECKQCRQLKNKGPQYKIDDEGRQCSKCKTHKPWTMFRPNKNGVKGHGCTCLDCRPISPKCKIDDVGRECSECGEYKPWKNFQTRRGNRHGKSPRCKSCQSEVTNKYNARPDVKKRIQERNGREEAKRKRREWFSSKKERVNLLRRRRYAKIKNNPRQKLHSRIHNLIRHRIKNKNGKRSFGDILPYTVDDLKRRFESLFEKNLDPGPDMSWENIGEWDIDHIKPDSSFDYIEPEDKGFQDSFALSNLMPRWHLTSIAKAHGSSQEGNVEKRDRMMFVNLDGFRTEGYLPNKKQVTPKPRKRKSKEVEGFFDLEKTTSSLYPA